mmetsp:Transcript_2199/g.5539  ORF Transcript_2199/g.5539 Transcript_2199/m.5539 type:complete len:221 (-) Transcript_2199:145-807(-)
MRPSQQGVGSREEARQRLRGIHREGGASPRAQSCRELEGPANRHLVRDRLHRGQQAAAGALRHPQQKAPANQIQRYQRLRPRKTTTKPKEEERRKIKGWGGGPPRRPRRHCRPCWPTSATKKMFATPLVVPPLHPHKGGLALLLATSPQIARPRWLTLWGGGLGFICNTYILRQNHFVKIGRGPQSQSSHTTIVSRNFTVSFASSDCGSLTSFSPPRTGF